MHLLMTVVWETGERCPAEVVVEAPPGSTTAELAAALRGLLGDHVPPGAVGDTWSLRANGLALTAESRLGQGGLVDGAVLTVARRLPGPAEPAGAAVAPLTLAVVSGPDAGREFPLRPGTVSVGRSAAADLTVADPDLSRSHIVLTVTDAGVRVSDAGSTNGTLVSGRPLPSLGQAVHADTITAGASRFQVRVPHRRPAAVTPVHEGVRFVNRGPRIARTVQPRTFTLPAEPQHLHRGRLPWVAMLAPVPVGAVLAVLFSPAMLAFALMSPLLMGATALSDRVQGRRSYAAQLAEHAAAARRVRASAAAALAEECQIRRSAAPDPAEVLAICTTPSARLWERRRTDPDMLQLRLGTWTATSEVRVVTAGGEQGPETLWAPDAPCTLSLSALGVVGVAGPRATTEAVGRHLLGQVAALHSHRDVTLHLLVAEETRRDAWQWVSRLPHNRIREGRGRLFACLETDEAHTAAAVQSLVEEVRRRRTNVDPGQPWSGVRTVVVLVGSRRLREVPGVTTLLSDGPGVGIAVLALDDDTGHLPSECRAVVQAAPTGSRTSWTLTTVDDSGGHGLVADQVGPWWADRLSRALAPLRDSTPDLAEDTLPDRVSLLDLLPFDARDPRVVGRRWRAQPGSTEVPLGTSTKGTFTVDLRRDGPHVLVGGTTGAGKSELLRTLVAGLAAVNRPDRLAFVLVDYKGGAAFRECAALPHTVGLVTDLDEHLTARALTSLAAELRRRETLLAAVGARDLDEWEQRRGAGHPALPRLVIVIDEFRVLAEEDPDFITGLVRIAAVGRSLGVHLVLATQRPAGVVSADIKANVTLRIALRVRDRADSDDVIDTPTAAGISEDTPGRALARTGSEPPRLFQTATVAGTRAVTPQLTVTPFGWTGGGCVQEPEPSQTTTSPLAELVDSLRAAAALLPVAEVRSPWLPPLPELVRHGDLPRLADTAAATLPLGLVDRPAEQEQEALSWDLSTPGHWAAIGTSGSGRTSFLRLVASQAVRRLPPTELHLYAVDGGRGGLHGLVDLPHTGAVVSRDDPGRLERLLRRLEDEVARRRSLHEPDALPTMLLLLDDWDLVAHEHDAQDHGLFTERVLALLREGAAVGLHAAVTGDRGLLHGRAASLFAERLVLRLADRTDAVLAGLSRTSLPLKQPPGRAVLVSEAAEVQLALVPSGPVHPMAAPRRSLSEAPPGHRPLRVEPLPVRVSRTELEPDRARDQPGPKAVAVGVGGDDLQVVGLDPRRDGALWLVAGAARSGRSTALATIGLGFLEAGTPLAVVTTRRGPLEGLRHRPGVVFWGGVEDAEGMAASATAHPTLAVLVDDADHLLDTPVEPVLRELARAIGRGRGGVVVCGATTSTLLTQYRGVAVEVARNQVGVLLGPRGVADCELFGQPTGHRRAGLGADRVAGRGLLVTANGSVEVQVATPEPTGVQAAAVTAGTAGTTT